MTHLSSARTGLRCTVAGVSPTVLIKDGFRVYFFSREEQRMHVHVSHADGEAKIWLDPTIELAQNYGLSPRRLRAALALVRRHRHEIRDAWRKHFDGSRE